MTSEEREILFLKALDSGDYSSVLLEHCGTAEDAQLRLIAEYISWLQKLVKTMNARKNMTTAEKKIFDHNEERETHIFNCITKRMPKELLDASGGTETIELRTAKVLAKMPIKHALNTTILNAQPDAVFWFLHEEDIQDLTREMTEFDDGSFLIGKEV